MTMPKNVSDHAESMPVSESNTVDATNSAAHNLDEALQTLATLDGKPLADQVDMLTEIHRQLTNSLSELDHL